MNWCIQILRALSLNCREAVRLQSEALDHPLSRWQRIGLRIHLILCVWCSRYGRNLLALRTAARHCEHTAGPESALPEEARKRIKQALQTDKKTNPGIPGQ